MLKFTGKFLFECLGAFFLLSNFIFKIAFWTKFFKVPQDTGVHFNSFPLQYHLKLYNSTYIHQSAATATSGSLLKCRRISGPIPDLLNQILHFHKIPTWCVCRLKFERHWLKSDLFFLIKVIWIGPFILLFIVTTLV